MHYVLYHKDCEDGFGAAWVAWQALGDTAQYLAINHGEPEPAMPDGSTVTMVDFAFPREATLALAHQATSSVHGFNQQSRHRNFDGLSESDRSRNPADL